MFGNEKPKPDAKKEESIVVTPELVSELVVRAFMFSKENDFKAPSSIELPAEVRSAIDGMEVADLVGLVSEEIQSFEKNRQRDFGPLQEPTMSFWYMLSKLQTFSEKN